MASYWRKHPLVFLPLSSKPLLLFMPHRFAPTCRQQIALSTHCHRLAAIDRVHFKLAADQGSPVT
jgi:hypothetical protein